MLQAASVEDFAPQFSEPDSLLEAQLNALREQLSAKDAEIVHLRQQAGESAQFLVKHIFSLCSLQLVLSCLEFNADTSTIPACMTGL